MWWLKAYLLLGLAFHKLVWEWLKSRPGGLEAPVAAPSMFRAAAKAVKLAILIALVVQAFVPDVWPIVADSARLRIAGAALFTLGLVTAVHARLKLGPWWADIEAGGVRPNHQVVGAGAYRWIRHPIYVGDLLLIAGYELGLNSWAVAGVAVLLPFVVVQARKEEHALAENVTGYAEYRKRTKAFIPYVI